MKDIIYYSLKIEDFRILIFGFCFFLFDLFGIIACILYSIKKSRHRNYLLRNFNDGKCPECGGEYEQIECEREYGLYKCPCCGKIIKVDDGDVDFAWNLRHYIL